MVNSCCEMKKVGLFFGSFNPIHIGHLALANYMLSFQELDEVWMVISPHNPLKEKKSLLNQHHRLHLLNMALEGQNKIKSCTVEFNLPQPSYTVNTLAHLKEKHPDHNFYLIMGSDNLMSFHKWKNYEYILNHYKMLVYPRPGFSENPYKENTNVIFTQAPLMDISSTFIRDAIKNNRNIAFFLPASVWEYLQSTNYYKN